MTSFQTDFSARKLVFNLVTKSLLRPALSSHERQPPKLVLRLVEILVDEFCEDNLDPGSGGNRKEKSPCLGDASTPDQTHSEDGDATEQEMLEIKVIDILSTIVLSTINSGIQSWAAKLLASVNGSGFFLKKS